MAAFLEDPRLRQRWNQISHNAETVTENAAAGIWTFQHTYVTPCLASAGEALDSCTAVCLGDREERARRQRERERGAHRSRAEYSFDFYDDWYDDFNDDGLDPGASDVEDDERAGASSTIGSGSGVASLFGRGFFGSWRGSRAEDWDRLLAGSGPTRGRHHDTDADGGAGGAGGDGDGTEGTTNDAGGAGGEVVDQPRRRRGMSYTTRAMRLKPADGDDPTIIPSTAPLGFLSRLPFKIGGPLRYKPSAANLREHPSGGSASSLHNNLSGRRLGGGADLIRARDENEPLLGGGNADYDYQGVGSGRRGAVPWQSELAAADASRQYGTADMTMAAVPAIPTTPATAATEDAASTAGTSRKRSGTTGSGDTSDSFRSRGDLFPSDEEDDEDAVPLDDEFAVALDRVDDRSSGRTRFSSSSSLAAATGGLGGGGGHGHQRKGKKRADTGASAASAVSAAPVSVKGVLSRSVSRTTINSFAGSSPRSPPTSIKKRLSSLSLPMGEAAAEEVEAQGEVEVPVILTPEQLREEDERAAREEDAEIARRREAAVRLARERGLAEAASVVEVASVVEDKAVVVVPVTVVGDNRPETAADTTVDDNVGTTADKVLPETTTTAIPPISSPTTTSQKAHEAEFVPARLPRFN